MKKALLKKEVEDMLNDLPEDANRDDEMHKIYVRQSIEQGLKGSEPNRTVTHKEVKKKYKLAE